MKTIVDISTGEVKSGDHKNVLVSNGIGSCIVVAAMNLEKHVGAMAHIMLPGKAPQKEKDRKTKYSVDAIDALLELLQLENRDTSQLRVCLVGAGNVLKKSDDTICKNNIESLFAILKKLSIQISASSLGGQIRRSVRFTIETGEVQITEGNSGLRLLNRWY